MAVENTPLLSSARVVGASIIVIAAAPNGFTDARK
jgi:hypothetical protein